jgi:hypothetical protein
MDNVHDVCEEYVSAWVYSDIVERVELASVIVVEENGGIVRRRGVDESKGGRTRTAARVDEEEAGLVGACAPVGHLNGFWKVQLTWHKFVTL